jgi:hypothetical protein
VTATLDFRGVPGLSDGSANQTKFVEKSVFVRRKEKARRLVDDRPKSDPRAYWVGDQFVFNVAIDSSISALMPTEPEVP